MKAKVGKAKAGKAKAGKAKAGKAKGAAGKTRARKGDGTKRAKGDRRAAAAGFPADGGGDAPRTGFPARRPADGARLTAVIDLGSTSIRMNIAQVAPDGGLVIIDTLEQPLPLGKETFNRGFIRKSTTEECVQALLSFRRALDENGVTGVGNVRVVATTAVREATNRDAFLDRLYIATGFDIQVLDEVDLVRLTFLSVRAHQSAPGFPKAPELLVVEMGGGSTEALLFKNGNVAFANTYRLGALRLREGIATLRAPLARQRELMTRDIERTVAQIRQALPDKRALALLAVGGDTRFAGSVYKPGWNLVDPMKIPVAFLESFAAQALDRSIESLVEEYHLSFPNAETLGPALLFYAKLARALGMKSVHACDVSMRHGFLVEMGMKGAWTADFAEQVVRSALDIGRKYAFNEPHARHVAHLSGVLFEALREDHRMDAWDGLLLRVAATLHDIGAFINLKSHHKHSMYLIRGSEWFGLGGEDIRLLSLVARYHRRSAPKPLHEEYRVLDREDRLRVSKLAAILRVADALDRSDSRRVRDFECSRERGQLVLTVAGVDDLALEEMALETKGTLFEDVYGMRVVLRKASRTGE